MNILLFYKGHYRAALRGPEMRYAALARELVKMKHNVTLCGRSGDRDGIPDYVDFISISNAWLLIKAFFRSDYILLHGGGPFVMLLAIISSFLGKIIVLDGYVPHWVELDEVASRKASKALTIKLLSKAYFNVARSLLGGLVFNFVIVANRRQQDMFRGMVAPFSLTHNFRRVGIIPFGCNIQEKHSTQLGREKLAALANTEFTSDDFLIGWLGGTYGWFDLGGVLTEVSKAICINKNIKIIFFGVEESRKVELLSFVDDSVKNNIVFLPWVDFSHRFEYWSGFDISLVWGGDGYENDYASRTRNFDCLTLGLPIVQNEDDEWGERLKQSNSGIVTNKDDLSGVLLDLSEDSDKISSMSARMSEIAPEFYWDNFAEKLIDFIQLSPMSLGRRLTGLVTFLLVLPAILTFFLFTVAISTLRR